MLTIDYQKELSKINKKYNTNMEHNIYNIIQYLSYSDFYKGRGYDNRYILFEKKEEEENKFVS